jgi:hypothetical protein
MNAMQRDKDGIPWIGAANSTAEGEIDAARRD